MKLRESPIISTMDWYLFTSTSIASIHCICKRNGIRTTEQRQHHSFLHCANCIRIKSMPNQCCWMGNIDSANHCIGKSWVDFCCSVSVNRWIQLFFFHMCYESILFQFDDDTDVDLYSSISTVHMFGRKQKWEPPLSIDSDYISISLLFAVTIHPTAPHTIHCTSYTSILSVHSMYGI